MRVTADEVERLERTALLGKLLGCLNFDWETARLSRSREHPVSMFFAGNDRPRYFLIGFKLPSGLSYSAEGKDIEGIWFLLKGFLAGADKSKLSGLDIFAYIQVVTTFAERFGTNEMKELAMSISAKCRDELVRNYRFVFPRNMTLSVRTYFSQWG